MKKGMCFLLTILGLLAGAVLGFAFSPVKKGMDIGSNSGNTTSNYYRERPKDGGEQGTK